jgi:CheY-like chemotaxis protein
LQSIDEAVPPFRTAACRGAREVVELRAGECARRGLVVGDRVTWAPVVDEADLPEVDAQPPDRRGHVLIASRDPRFTKLTRVLLDGRGIGVTGVVAADQLAEELADADVDVILLDAGDNLADGLRASAVATAAAPEVNVVMVGEGAAERAPDGQRVYDKWDETDEFMSAVEATVGAGDRGQDTASA